MGQTRTVIGIAALGIVVTGAIVLIESLSTSPEHILSGPPVHLKIGSTSLCVGRQFLEPTDLERAARDGIFTGYLGERASLAMFSPALFGFTTDHYKAGIANVMDKRHYPSDWVRITIFPTDLPPAWRFELDPVIKQSYESDSTIDSGFRSHRSRRDCVGKVAGEGTVQVQIGPECLDQEFKYDHPAERKVILLCTPQRCQVRNRLHHHGVWFDYDFPRSYLEQWQSLHASIHKRIAEGARHLVPSVPIVATNRAMWMG